MIYLDHAAATPVLPQALSAMMPYFSEQFFNPSAPYLPAKRVREAYEAAKNQIAHVIGAKGTDLVITAGATDSVNLAFTVCAQIPHVKILVLATEHAAVIETAKQYNYDFIRVDSTGLIDLQDLRRKLTPEVVLISVSLANNEIGTIQPLADVAELIRHVRQERLKQGNTTPIYLHSDASQALSLIDLNVSRLGVDLLTINAAKCGGPKGVGGLYLAHGVPVHPLTLGGGQERGLRSGTENVPGVIGFATALEDAKKHLSSRRKTYQKMASILRQELAHISIVSHHTKKVNNKTLSVTRKTPEAQIFSSREYPSTKTSPASVAADYIVEPIFLGNPKHQLVNFVPVCFPGIDAERLIYRLEQREVCLSTGAACAANKGSKSHVLSAIGLSDTEITGSVRISLGSTNTLDNVATAAHIIREEVEREYRRLGERHV